MPAAPPAKAQSAAPKESASALEAKFITSQGADQWVFTKFKGSDVPGPDNARIGSVSDLLFDGTGKIIGVVVGVGGFLRIGVKNVAIDMRSQWPGGIGGSPRRSRRCPGRRGRRCRGRARRGLVILKIGRVLEPVFRPCHFQLDVGRVELLAGLLLSLLPDPAGIALNVRVSLAAAAANSQATGDGRDLASWYARQREPPIK
jgi:hypothetical protein